MRGRRCVVTGANAGIGEVTARELARAGAEVVLACRDEDKARAAMARIEAAVPDARLRFAALDLSSLASVRRCADALASEGEPLDVLVNNAGLTGVRAVSEDGFELLFAVNHLGHFLLTERLIPRLLASRDGRVINVSSRAHERARRVDWDALRRKARTHHGEAYCVSKLCNVLHARGLHARYGGDGLAAYALHPGVVNTRLWRRLGPIGSLMGRFMITSEQGAVASLRCATGPREELVSGRYYDEDGSPKAPNPLALDDALVDALWEHSVAWTR